MEALLKLVEETYKGLLNLKFQDLLLKHEYVRKI
jgi:hypothetical protein